jgi:hypothetical protein
MMDTLAWRVLEKAQAGTLKSVYFEPWGPFPYEAHRALVDALAAYGTAKMVTLSYKAMTDQDIARVSRQIRTETEQFQPDLVIIGYTGDMLDVGELARLRETCPDTFVVDYIADAATFNDKLYAICKACHLTVVASPSYFPALATMGIAAGAFPGWTQHQYLQVERELTEASPDVVFIGSLYFDHSFPGVAFRRETVQAMAHGGLKFDLYGPGWERAGVTSKGSTFGQYARNAAIYAGAKIGLSVDDVRDKYCCCSDRPYNIAATGCMVLTASFPGMGWNGWIDGATCAAFDTIPEMLDKARYYLAHDEERERIAQAGREMVHKRHTWPARIEALWAMLEGLRGGHDD